MAVLIPNLGFRLSRVDALSRATTLFGPGGGVASGAVEVIRAAAGEFERVVGSLPVDVWDNGTPCDITVREVVDHVVAGNVFAVRLLAGASVAEATAGLDADQLGDDPLGAVVASCESQSTAFAGADENRVLHHPSGDISLDTFVRFRLGELVVHSWDLAVGGGLDPSLDPAVIEALWALVEPNLDEMRTMGAFGPGASANLPDNSSPQNRLLDAFGRRP
ncbi:TIGR03086 family metal-binding protein [Kribbella qitaiheensis]|uniref:TIGR03086 family metal-binding protein n=1 Tax=Kribbella qitaiheensis TaxID=1544730 RepID=UPI00360B44F2